MANEIEIERRPGIYQIVNVSSNKRYVGSSQNVKKRLIQHESDLTSGRHFNTRLQRSYKKNSDAFRFYVVEYVESVCDLLSREQDYLDVLFDDGDLCFNIIPTAGSQRGAKRSKLARQKMSLAQLGNKASEETKRKMSEARLAYFAKNPAAKKECGASRLGKTHTKEAREKISQAHTGRKHTENARKAMSIAASNRKMVR